MKRITAYVSYVVLGLVLSVPSSAQNAPSTSEQTLRERTVRLNSLAGPTLGKAGAPITIVEFTDLQCPFCRQFTATAFQEIRKNYIDTGLVRFITKDFPIDTLHPFAMKAARASRCAGEQRKAWEMRHAILANDQLSDALIQTIATTLSLNQAPFLQCIQSPKYDGAIEKDLSDGYALGVMGTPSFVIGRTPGAGALEGTLVVGARPYEHFDALLKTLMASVEAR